ncbi:MAG TPA: acyl-CoA thioesterase [Candidatus Omnitrophota bacterium]|nr:acyl-CoA thioesterase [Candidatus Omnitrophota bacterium]HPT39836.1 acyl-CoA thioesterase [Candidatus Omnitrophota bacterium]
MDIKRKEYFKRIEADPQPLSLSIKRRVSFNEVDPLGIVWYGNYAIYFEEAQAELCRRCGLTYQDYFSAKLRPPIVAFHIDYQQPLYLDEEFTVKASLIWCEGAKINMEYEIIKEDGSIATRGYTIQVLVEEGTKQACIIAPELISRLRKRWQNGEFKCLK